MRPASEILKRLRWDAGLDPEVEIEACALRYLRDAADLIESQAAVIAGLRDNTVVDLTEELDMANAEIVRLREQVTARDRAARDMLGYAARGDFPTAQRTDDEQKSLGGWLVDDGMGVEFFTDRPAAVAYAEEVCEATYDRMIAQFLPPVTPSPDTEGAET